MTGDSSHLFPNTFYTLDTWAASILRQPFGAKQCLLEQVVHYKALSSMEHEFLIVYATHRPSGSKIVLGVDRNQAPVVFPNTAQPSALQSLARKLNLNKLKYVKSSLSSTSVFSSSEESPHRAYDGVQVSHDGTPASILAVHGPSIPLLTITFPPTTSRPPAASSSSTSSSDAEHPSLLHLSTILLMIRTNFPFYALLEYQCYFFARVACLVLMDRFGGVETELKEARRAATWRGVHVSLYSEELAALRNGLLRQTKHSLAKHSLAKYLPYSQARFLEIAPAGLFVVYSAVKLYRGNMVDRRQIRSDCLVFRATSWGS